MQATLFVGVGLVGREVRTLDLSWNGARVRCDEVVLKPGQPVDLILLDGSTKFRRPARVVWAEKAKANGVLEAGLEFARSLARGA